MSYYMEINNGGGINENGLRFFYDSDTAPVVKATERYVCTIEMKMNGRFPDVIYFNGRQYGPVEEDGEHLQTSLPASEEAACASADTSPK